MSEAIYMKDSYLKEFDAKVVSVSKNYLILDKTAFFPKGGGVDCDTGKIIRNLDNKEFNVVFTGKFNNEISHELDAEGLNKEDEVRCIIDWDRRYKLMRYHTATHVLCGVFSRDYGLLVTGNQLTTEKGRVDLNMEHMDLNLVKEAFEKANKIIQNDLAVETYTISMDEAKKDPTLFKLAIGFPHDIKELRIVDIKGFDAQADGGCHVNSLEEIGKLVFKEALNKGKNNRRIYFEVE